MDIGTHGKSFNVDVLLDFNKVILLIKIKTARMLPQHEVFTVVGEVKVPGKRPNKDYTYPYRISIMV